MDPGGGTGSQFGHEFGRRPGGGQLAQLGFEQFVIAVVHASTSLVSRRSSSSP